VFEVTEGSAKIDVDGQPVYVCCPACAEYFAKHRDRVLDLRGIAPSG
jgi:hypothetical protein